MPSLDDQIEARCRRSALGDLHELDLARVGVFGWSFGGYFSTMALLLRPDVFACAVAGAPVTDWSFYDTAYTERYMRTPETNAAGYASTSALTHAAKLARPLLIIHGITDDNVHFGRTRSRAASKRSTSRASAGRADHAAGDAHGSWSWKLNLAREQVQIDFFRQHLGAP